MEKPLVVYKASAGSGKTFTLAIEYIKLIILNPQDFRAILAVTFTNKATEEMKKRILSQLYGIWKQLEDSQVYIDIICHDCDLSPKYISNQAGIALRLLLHNYNYFRIETIDSFFQSILRNLARELDLTANLRIGINDSQVEENAVDELIDELDNRNEILQWIIQYIKDNISDDKSWNVIGQIKAFGKTIFKDFYKESEKLLETKLCQSHFFEQYISNLNKEKAKAIEQIRIIAGHFFSILDTEGLVVSDFAYGEMGVGGFFLKLKKGFFDESIVGKRVSDCIDNPEKWTTKGSPNREKIHDLAENRLIDILKTAINERAKQWRRYKSAEVTLRHLSQVRLLNSIEKKVRELNDNANRFLLSDTQYFLMSLIKDSDSPFIYEKIGTQLKHIMIDEFQDTSAVQWKNFKVLLMDCMSRNYSRNIIVGDVKQSIYRWRDSDWRLLNDIDQQFSLPEKRVSIRSLATNYRSQCNIINFNNVFFKTASEIEYANQAEGNQLLAEQLRNAYSDVEQFIPDKRIKTGLVNIKLLPNKDYYEQTLNEVCSTVGYLLGEGIPQARISILVRTNNYIPLIAKSFMERMPDVKIVSDEAFRLDSSLAVNMLIHALHLLTHANDSISNIFLAKAYQNEILHNNLSDDELFLFDVSLDNMLPKAFTESKDKLRNMSLYTLTEKLYRIFNIKSLSNQSAYICSFFDYLSDFTEESSTDIDAFLDTWNNEISGKTIQGDEIDGIRLISIHKSKGLEFENVIIPFCDWQIEKSNGNIIWCHPNCSPFDELPLVPVDYSSKLVGTIYEKDYIHECLQNCVDNLNLLYVAFTRASNNMFIIGKRDAKNSRSTLIQKSIPFLASSLENATISGDEDIDKAIEFKYGSIANSKGGKNKKQTSNLFLQPTGQLQMKMETFVINVKFKQSNKSHDFIDGTDCDSEQDCYIKMGNILHKVFSSISTLADIDDVLQSLEIEGVLYDEDITSSNIVNILKQRLSDKRIQYWFSDKWTLFNECTILSVDNETGQVIERRPDRVMTDGTEVIVVDFKFGNPRDEYLSQVRQYMDLLTDMGYNNVKGYLWFVYTNKIVEV